MLSTNSSKFIIRMALGLVILLIGCNRPRAGLETANPFSPLFTYSTSDGAIWQIDALGKRELLIAADGSLKRDLKWSDDRTFLAFVTSDFPPPQQLRTEALYVMDSRTKNVKHLLGPADNINLIEWLNHQIQATLFDISIDPKTPPQDIPYEDIHVDAETGRIISLKLTRTRQPPSQSEIIQERSAPLKSPNGQWAISNEINGSKIGFYLLDKPRKRVAEIYDQPMELPFGGVIWSPDSQWFIYQVPENPSHISNLYLYDVLKRKSKQLTQFIDKGIPPPLIRTIQWAPNSQWFMFMTDANGIANQLCYAKTESQNATCLNAQWNPDNFVISRDSRMIAFLARMGNEHRDLYVLDVPNEKVINLTNSGKEKIEDSFTAY